MSVRRQPLRLLADDLTGALDSAAAFASMDEPVMVGWRGAVPGEGAIALDSRSREASSNEARAAVADVAPALWAPGSGLAFKKIDSLLRGQEVAELETILFLLRPRHCLIAPAFPAQRRITRAGRQYAWSDGGWDAVATDLAGELARAGHRAVLRKAGDAVPPGTSFWDAESDADLDAVVAAAGGIDGVLWVGSGGLAAALARAAGYARPGEAAHLPQPILGLVGSEHAAIREQLGRLGPLHRLLGEKGEGDDEIARRLRSEGVVFASLDLPQGTSRRDAAAMIEARFAGLLAGLDRPGTLVAAGGETLRGLCETLGVERLDVTGDIVPGMPRSLMRGGRWDGVTVVSKSGAFGGPDLLRQLVAAPLATMAGAAA